MKATSFSSRVGGQFHPKAHFTSAEGHQPLDIRGEIQRLARRTSEVYGSFLSPTTIRNELPEARLPQIITVQAVKTSRHRVSIGSIGCLACLTSMKSFSHSFTNRKHSNAAAAARLRLRPKRDRRIASKHPKGIAKPPMKLTHSQKCDNVKGWQSNSGLTKPTSSNSWVLPMEIGEEVCSGSRESIHARDLVCGSSHDTSTVNEYDDSFESLSTDHEDGTSDSSAESRAPSESTVQFLDWHILSIPTRSEQRLEMPLRPSGWTSENLGHELSLPLYVRGPRSWLQNNINLFSTLNRHGVFAINRQASASTIMGLLGLSDFSPLVSMAPQTPFHPFVCFLPRPHLRFVGTMNVEHGLESPERYPLKEALGQGPATSSLNICPVAAFDSQDQPLIHMPLAIGHHTGMMSTDTEGFAIHRRDVYFAYAAREFRQYVYIQQQTAAEENKEPTVCIFPGTSPIPLASWLCSRSSNRETPVAIETIPLPWVLFGIGFSWGHGGTEASAHGKRWIQQVFDHPTQKQCIRDSQHEIREQLATQAVHGDSLLPSQVLPTRENICGIGSFKLSVNRTRFRPQSALARSSNGIASYGSSSKPKARPGSAMTRRKNGGIHFPSSHRKSALPTVQEKTNLQVMVAARDRPSTAHPRRAFSRESHSIRSGGRPKSASHVEMDTNVPQAPLQPRTHPNEFSCVQSGGTRWCLPKPSSR